MPLRIVMSSGHGLKVRGASGSPVPPELDEVDEARKVVNRTAQILNDGGVPTTVFHDNVSTSQDENLNRIVNFHNSKSRDYDVSVHFNATEGAYGTEVWYTNSDMADYAAKISAAIAKAGGFKDRGKKHTDNLFFLNNTAKPAVLLEVCFCDSTDDSNKYRQHFEAICHAIAESIAGKPLGESKPPIPPSEVPIPPERPPEAPRRDLEKGDQGADVAALQKSLGISADGDFGSVTEAQVKAFQAASGLVADGIVGPQTWTQVDALDRRMAEGGNGIAPGLASAVAEIASESELVEYNWPDRGIAPPGYIIGMAQTFALAVEMYLAESDAAYLMSAAETGDDDTDALAWLRQEFAAVGMSNRRAGFDTLRHLFVLLIGLGLRDSFGR